ncbi:kinesin-like protein KIN-5C [Papaver somniferum]|uniref:kinesin-like protein KIN-5C n=1 Tax=Papaver somniferum TaxID=3469 RepID=UPI000E6F7790|nr:kinesin-like protein KIN-5C [Papaver somniferum]
MSSRQEKEKGVNVQVLLRCRPFSDDELRNNAPQVVTCNDYQREVAVSQNIAGKQIDRVFTFDKVFGPAAQQKELYDQAVVPIVNEVLEGFNCTIFAYGQTGTGKTFTMEGESRKSKNGASDQLPAEAGVIPRAVKQIFDTLESQNAEYSVKVTFLELYNEEITDLLAHEEITKFSVEEKQKKQLPLMEDGKGGVLVRGLEEEIVTNTSEIFTLLERGSAKRRTAETLLNKQSSRSHSLFSITIHIKETTPEGEELIKCGKLNLVDLAGSENICRSGAREGRAREAGEINKSLLTLGRVINALVEHLGHIPYRDSKLTRLLRDSLGGRTKTCIIATVSPAVHCLEETLSTLDYAHRAKNIKNKPEVNQKMMKTTLIKDLYGEIDRLKAEVYATREKNGVYIPKERYYQEESERKAMADQIEQMGLTLEANQKQIEELQEKYDGQVQQANDLRCKLDTTQKYLDHTCKLLSRVEEELKKSQYALKERDYIISEQQKAETALSNQACVLRSDLEKTLQENALLFSKLDREDKLNVKNKSVVDKFQAELADKIKALCSTVSTSLSEQNEHIHSVEKLCQSLLEYHDKSAVDLKKKVAGSRGLLVSHIEAMQNVVRLHKASSNASLDEISSVTSANADTIEKFLSTVAETTNSTLGELQSTISSHQEEMSLFSKELHKRFHISIEQTKEMSQSILGFLDRIREESCRLDRHTGQVHETQQKYIAEFQRAYEEQSKTEAEQLLADMAILVSNHINHQKELVGTKLVGLSNTITESKAFLDGHTVAVDGITTDAKRKWQAFSHQAENDAKDAADYSSATHCHVDLLLNQCLSNVENASQQWKKTHESVLVLDSEHVSAMEFLVRNASENNEQHDMEISSARAAAEEDVTKTSENILQHFDRVSKHDQESVSGIMTAIKAQSNTQEKLLENHAGEASEIERQVENTFQKRYMDYEPSGTTPTRSEQDVPSKGTIESLRAMPMETLLEEFRENHPYVPTPSKELKPSLIPRSPLIQLN